MWIYSHVVKVKRSLLDAESWIALKIVLKMKSVPELHLKKAVL